MKWQVSHRFNHGYLHYFHFSLKFDTGRPLQQSPLILSFFFANTQILICVTLPFWDIFKITPPALFYDFIFKNCWLPTTFNVQSWKAKTEFHSLTEYIHHPIFSRRSAIQFS